MAGASPTAPRLGAKGLMLLTAWVLRGFDARPLHLDRDRFHPP